MTTIPSATTAYSLLDASATTNNHSWQYFHAPAAASTYVFPAVTDDSVAHRIKLTIDFAAVQTYSFEDAEGNALTPLFTPTISAGDVYEFDCEYSAVKSQWLVWPHKQGAVSDDYVMQSQRQTSSTSRRARAKPCQTTAPYWSRYGAFWTRRATEYML